MLGIDDFWVWSAYLLSLLSAALCVGYGLWSRKRNGETPPVSADMAWQQEEDKIDEAL